MYRIAIALLASALFTLPAHAQDDPQDNAQDEAPADPGKAQPKQVNHLEPIGWLVGSWRGKGKMNGQPYTDEVTYKWMFGKHFIRSTYVAKMGPQVVWKDTTTVGWDKKNRRLKWFTFGMDGSLGGGHYEPQASDKPNTWVIYGSVGDDPKSEFAEARTYIVRKDDDHYTSLTQTKKDGKWVTFMESSYTRVKPDKAGAKQ